MKVPTTCGLWKTQSYLGTFWHCHTLPGRLKSLKDVCNFNLSCNLCFTRDTQRRPWHCHGGYHSGHRFSCSYGCICCSFQGQFRCTLDIERSWVFWLAKAGDTFFLCIHLQKSLWLWVQTDVWPQSGFSSSEAVRSFTPLSCPDTATAFGALSQFFSQICSSGWLAGVPANWERTEVLAAIPVCLAIAAFHLHTALQLLNIIFMLSHKC